MEGLEQEGETTSERRSANDEGDYREKSVGQRQRGEKEREKECDEKHTGEKGELQLQSRRGRMTTHRHIGFHFHFSRRSIRAPALPLPVHSPSLSLSRSVCSRLMQWMSTVCRSSPMVCSLPTWKVESVSARVYSRWEGWLNAESLSNSPRISECAYTPAPLFTYANEYGSMPLIRILDPAFLRLLFHSFQGYPSVHPSIHPSVYPSILSVCLSDCRASVCPPSRPASSPIPIRPATYRSRLRPASLLSQFSDRGYLVRLR